MGFEIFLVTRIGFAQINTTVGDSNANKDRILGEILLT
jgi:hypothetical protein